MHLAGSFLLALALRVAHVLSIRDAPFFRHLFLDPLFYDSWAVRIAGGDWLGRAEGVFFQDPAYPYLLALLYALFGHDYLAATLVQAVLGSLIPPLLYLAARRWLDTPAALIAALLAAVYPPAVYYDGLILKTWLGVLLATASLLALSRAVGTARPAPWVAAGLVLGAATLARGNLLLLLPVLAVWAFVDPSATVATGAGRGGPRRPGTRRTLAVPLALIAGASVVLAVSAVRNRVVGGDWALTTANAGQNFYIGNNALNSTGEYALLPFVDPDPGSERADFAREAQRRTGRELRPGEVSRFWFAESRRWIREHPGDWLRLLWRKLRNYLGAYEIPDNLDYYLVRESSPVLRLPLPGFGLVAPLGLLGALLLARRGGWPRALLLFLVTTTLSVVLFFVFSRFRMAAMPALFVLAGHALVALGRDVAEARAPGAARARLARRLVLLLMLLAFVNLPVRAPEDHLAVRVARGLGLPVTPETSATGHYNLGLAHAIQAERSDDPDLVLRLAETELRRSIAEDPGLARVHLELGKVLARLDREREALGAYREAVRLDPRDGRAWIGLGILERRAGTPAGAEAALRRAVALAPRSAMAHTLLGETLLELGRPGEAAAAFRAALEVRPDSERARRGLDRAGAAAARP